MNLQQMESEDLDILIAKMLSEMKQTQMEQDKKEYYPVNEDGSIDIEFKVKCKWDPYINVRVWS